MSDKKWEFNWDWVDPGIRDIIVSDEVRLNRQNICKTCDKLNKMKMCKICHCFMPGKILLKSSNCPEEKWGAVE